MRSHEIVHYKKNVRTFIYGNIKEIVHYKKTGNIKEIVHYKKTMHTAIYGNITAALPNLNPVIWKHQSNTN